MKRPLGALLLSALVVLTQIACGAEAREISTLPDIAIESMTPGTGAVRGIVFDNAGGVIPGATVTITNTTNIVRATTTDAAGRFSINSVVPGAYVLATDLPGFRRHVREIAISSAAVTSALITIEAGPLEEMVTVMGSSPLVETRSETLSAEEIKALPLNSETKRAYQVVRALAYDAGFEERILITDGLPKNSAYWQIIFPGSTVSTRTPASRSGGRVRDMVSVTSPATVDVGEHATIFVRLSKEEFDRELETQPPSVRRVYLDKTPPARAIAAELSGAARDVEIEGVGPPVQSMSEDDDGVLFQFRVKLLTSGVHYLTAIVSEAFGRWARVLDRIEFAIVAVERQTEYWSPLWRDTLRAALVALLVALFRWLAMKLYEKLQTRPKQPAGFKPSLTIRRIALWQHA